MVNVEYINPVNDIYTNNGEHTITIGELPEFDREQYDIYNEKDFHKLIDDSERVSRTSYEYRTLMRYLNNTEGMNECTFLSNVTNKFTHAIKIEIHHTPFTLFDIANAVVHKRLTDGDSIDVFDIAKEIMWLHYMGYIGLIPVCKTVHDMIHNNFLFVPLHIIRGNFQMFAEMYHEHIDPMVMDAYENAKLITDDYLNNKDDEDNIVNKQMKIFNHFVTYYNIEDEKPLYQMLPDVNKAIRDRVEEIKSGKKVLYHLITKVNTKEPVRNM